MKKFAMAAVAAAALSAGVAQAYTVGTFSNGFVVPNVIHNGDTDTTAVGIINQTAGTVGVFWTFFDANSNHVTDGCFAMTSKDYEPFIWSQQSGQGLAGTRGYLVFAVGADTAAGSAAAACAPSNAVVPSATGSAGLVSANAFHVNTAAQDVAFVPVIDGNLTFNTATATTDLTNLGPDSLVGVAGARSFATPATFSMRYAVDGTLDGGLETRIVVWSTGNQKGTHTVNMYDAAQNRKSVNFALAETELSFFNPETIPGRPANFTDGFIEWTPTIGTATTGMTTATAMFTYSLITAPAFGATQSILGSHN